MLLKGVHGPFLENGYGLSIILKLYAEVYVSMYEYVNLYTDVPNLHYILKHVGIKESLYYRNVF